MGIYISCTCQCGNTSTKPLELTKYNAKGKKCDTVRLACEKCGNVMFVVIKDDTQN